MDLKIIMILTLTVPLCFGSMLGCTQKNRTCEELKWQDSFMYPHDCPDKSQIDTKIAYANFGIEPNLSICLREGMRFDEKAFFMGECQDLHIKCVSPIREQYVKGSCLTYKIIDQTEEPTSLTSNDLSLGSIVGVSVTVTVLVIVGLFFWYFCLKKRAKPATPLLFCGVCSTKGVSNIGEAGDQRSTDASAAGSTDPDDVVANQNTSNKLREIQPETGLSETEENEKNSGLESNVDPEADGGDPKSLKEDFIIIDETQSSENENKTVPSRASRHRPMNRHLTGDPGGVCYNKEEHSVRIVGSQKRRTRDDGGLEEEETEGAALPLSSGPSEWSAAHESTDSDVAAAAYRNAQNEIWNPENRGTLADHSPEEDKTEGDPLLPRPGAAIQFSDMTGEAAALVDGAASPTDPARKFLSTGQ